MEGVGQDFVVTVQDVIGGKKAVAGKVIIIGSGMTGLECAERLCNDGCQVTMIEMQDQIGPGMFSVIIQDMMKRIRPFNPVFLTRHQLTGFTDRGIVAKDLSDGSEKTLDADYVILSLGVRPAEEKTAELVRAFPHTVVIGDNVQSGKIPHAMRDAYIKALCFLQ